MQEGTNRVKVVLEVLPIVGVAVGIVVEVVTLEAIVMYVK